LCEKALVKACGLLFGLFHFIQVLVMLLDLTIDCPDGERPKPRFSALFPKPSMQLLCSALA